MVFHFFSEREEGTITTILVSSTPFRSVLFGLEWSGSIMVVRGVEQNVKIMEIVWVFIPEICMFFIENQLKSMCCIYRKKGERERQSLGLIQFFLTFTDLTGIDIEQKYSEWKMDMIKEKMGN